MARSSRPTSRSSSDRRPCTTLRRRNSEVTNRVYHHSRHIIAIKELPTDPPLSSPAFAPLSSATAPDVNAQSIQSTLSSAITCSEARYGPSVPFLSIGARKPASLHRQVARRCRASCLLSLKPALPGTLVAPYAKYPTPANTASMNRVSVALPGDASSPRLPAPTRGTPRFPDPPLPDPPPLGLGAPRP